MTSAQPETSDPIEKAVEDYLLMERKARAWDQLVSRASCCDVDSRGVLDMDSVLVQNAP